MRNYHKYTIREINWLKRNVRPGFSWEKIAKGFNAKFHTEIEPLALRAAYVRYERAEKQYPKINRRKTLMRGPKISDQDAEDLEKLVFGRKS